MTGGEYRDDPTISDDAELWRRIPPNYICYDENRRVWRPESWAFSDDEDGDPMSAFIGAECGGVDVLLRGLDDYGIAAITAGFARERGQIIYRRPDAPEPGHVFVHGPKTRSAMRAFARSCRWVHLPPRPAS